MRNPKILVITGASSGLGAALAINYASLGVKLFLTARNQDRLEKVVKICKDKGAEVCSFICDIRDYEKISNWLLTIDKIEPIDLIFANAGVSAGTLGGEDVNQVKNLFSTNIDGVINTIFPVLEKMKTRRRGQIAIISSMASLVALPSCPAYSASKAAVRFYGQAIRGVLKEYGIGVTVIIPGYIKTPMTEVNDFPMPFIISSDKAAQIIKKQMVKNPNQIVFPRIFYLLIWLISILPSFLSESLLASLPRKSNINKN